MPNIRKSLQRDAQSRKQRMSRTTSRAFLLLLDEQAAKRDRQTLSGRRTKRS